MFCYDCIVLYRIVLHQVDREIAALEAQEEQEQQLAILRRERAQFWTETARAQKQEAASYDRFLVAKKEEKAREKALGESVKYKPSARQSYEEWAVKDEEKQQQLYAQAVVEEGRAQARARQQQQGGAAASQLQGGMKSCGGVSASVNGGGGGGGGGGGMGYDSSMFAGNDDDDGDDDLGGTTSVLTEEELACGMDFEGQHEGQHHLQHYQQQQQQEDQCHEQHEHRHSPGGSEQAAVTSAEMTRMMQPPPPRDWMSLQSDLLVPPSEHSWSNPGDFFNDLAEDSDRGRGRGYRDAHVHNAGGAQGGNEAKTFSKPHDLAAKKQSVKSAISEYNAKNKSRQSSKKQSTHTATSACRLYKSSSASGDDMLDKAAKVVSDAEMNRMKNDLEIFQSEEEMTQLLVKQKELTDSLDKIEDTIEKIDTMLYRHERECDDEHSESISSQLHIMIEKLKQSQRVAEKKKEHLEEQVFVVEKEMKKVSTTLKTLKGKHATESSSLRLPDIRNKFSR
jgi:hypothetical protein